ncbi:MAG: ankyrin-like [Candidatus Midichloriaceae bacterium]|jgi:ankyrin repeat protein|nr:ankyrin-like [Candidatus Midichloriaceae bacterium]
MSTDANDSELITNTENEQLNQLIDAVKEDDIMLVEKLLKAGVNSNLCSDHINAPLYRAIHNKNFKMVKMLLEYGANPNLILGCASLPFSPLGTVAWAQSIKIAKLLIKNGADVNGSTNILDNAATLKTTAMLKFFLKNGADFALKMAKVEENADSCYYARCNHNNGFPLCTAAAYGRIKNVKFLMSYLDKKQPEERAMMLSQALHEAAYEQRLEIVRLLLKAGANPNYVDNLGGVLRYAIIGWVRKCYDGGRVNLATFGKRKVQIIELLLKHGAEFSNFEKEGNLESEAWVRTIEIVVYSQDVEVLEYLYNKRPSALGKAREVGERYTFESLLSHSVKKNRLGVVKFLLEKGMDPNDKCCDDIPVALHAIRQGNTDIFEELLNKGASFNAAYEYDKQFICDIIDKDRIDILKLMLKYWSEFLNCPFIPKISEDILIAHSLQAYNSVNKWTLTKKPKFNHVYSLPPLLYAIYQDKEKVLECFLENGADPNIVAESGYNALIECVKAKDIKGVELLIKYGANVNIQDECDNTPLTWASFFSLNKIILMLLKAGADVDIQNKDEENALYWGYEAGSKSTHEILMGWKWSSVHSRKYFVDVAMIN